MTLDLDELERLEREAADQAPPPWVAGAAREDGTACVYLPSDGPCRRIVPVAETSVQQAGLIAAARNALPGLLAELRALRARVRCSACLPWENPCETCARTAERINATPPEPAAPLSRCWRCKHDVPEDTVVCFAGVGTQCKDRKACRERSYVAPEPATPPEHPQAQNAYHLGCIVGAAIVAWGDAMRGMVRFSATQARILRDYGGTFKALAMVDDRTDEQRHEDNDCGCVSDPDDPQRSYVCIHAIRMLSAEAVRILADGPEFSGGDGPDPEDV